VHLLCNRCFQQTYTEHEQMMSYIDKLTLYTYQEMTYVEMRCTQNRLSPLLRFVIAVCMPHMYFLLNTWQSGSETQKQKSLLQLFCLVCGPDLLPTCTAPKEADMPITQ